MTQQTSVVGFCCEKSFNAIFAKSPIIYVRQGPKHATVVIFWNGCSCLYTNKRVELLQVN